MTIYGGTPTDYGNNKDGFFVTCAKCGWHSKVVISPSIAYGDPVVIFECLHCENRHEES